MTALSKRDNTYHCVPAGVLSVPGGRAVCLFILFPFLLLLVSCHKQRDRNGILTERAMAEVMYDYQLAVALADDEGGADVAEREYRYTQAALRRHGVTDAEYRLSIAHYARDPKAMLALTQRVGDRFLREVEKAQAEAMAGDTDGTLAGSSSRDTLVVWQDRGGVILNAATDHLYSLSIPGDRIESCDMVVFGFRADWLSRADVHNASVILTITYEGDSIARRQEGIRDLRFAQGVRIPISTARAVRRIDVHVCQTAPWSPTPQLLSLTDLSLWCLRKNR